MILFLDANVLIDFLMSREDFYKPAATIISFAAKGKVEISVTSLSMVTANFICLERGKMPLEFYREKIDFLRDFMKVIPVDEKDIFASYDARWKDFEDGVQYYAAERYGFDYIVTRNKKDFECDNSKLLSPDEACEMLESIEKQLKKDSTIKEK